MLDDDNKLVLADDVDSELFQRLRDPGLLKTFAALEEDLRRGPANCRGANREVS